MAPSPRPPTADDPPARPAHLAVEDLDLERGGAPVLHDVAVAFPAGEVTAVVGPSGAGKSSLLRCLNRLEEPVSGRVLLDGVDVATLDPRHLRRQVGMIFQLPVVFDGDVAANLAYALDGAAAAPDRLEHALVAAGLDPRLLPRDAASLSVGQAQRMCLARALLRGPRALLLDEPTASLDQDATAVVEDLVVGLAGRGITVVVVTHDLGQAERVATRAVLLVDGRVVATGPPAEVRRHWPAGARR